MLTHPDFQLLEEITPNSTEMINPEAWFWINPEAIAEVHTGIAQAAAGEVQYLGSFAEYADIDIDDYSFHSTSSVDSPSPQKPLL